MRTLGMIGGTSWHSTIEYYRLINELTSKVIGPLYNPPLILYSLNVELMRSGDWERINKTFLQYSEIVETAGAEAIIFCANTPHKVYDFVQPKIGIPILHIADAAAENALERRIRKPGILGTLPTMEDGFLRDRMADKYGLECLIPDTPNRENIHRIIADELTQGKFTTQSKLDFLGEMEILRKNGADGIILGCTELPMLIKKDEFELPLLDTTYLHAESAVDFILSNGGQS